MPGNLPERCPAVPPPVLWSLADLARIPASGRPEAPLIVDKDIVPVDPAIGVWDAWPILRDDGALHVEAGGSTLWFALGAPHFDDPDARHAHARIYFLEQSQAGSWRNLGPAMPDGFSPGTREWSGSAVIDPDGSTITLFFTAAGMRGRDDQIFAQRLFQARANLVRHAGRPRLAAWRDLRESLVRDPAFYMDPNAGAGRIGTIKAFRDPYHFLDPLSGKSYLFFTASLAGSLSLHNGIIGAAVAGPSGSHGWTSLPPLLSANDLNNELERPHVIRRDGLYYLFWSTQSHVFAPEASAAPTGLYGMVSKTLLSGWTPLNRSGLVLANPEAAPRQAYSWLVLPDLRITSFVDDWGSNGASRTGRRFGGCFAPFLTLRLDGDRAILIADRDASQGRT